MITIASVVEGEGEVTALPRLLYKLAAELGVVHLRTPVPFRRNRGSLVAPGGIERAVASVALRITGAGGVLVLLDADDDCPADLGPVLLARAKSARPDVHVSVVLAMREFEAWFLAAAPSFAGALGVPEDLASPPQPEEVRGAKEWLTGHRSIGRPYKPTVDQAQLVSAFDVKLAREHSPSFDKLYREIMALLRACS